MGISGQNDDEIAPPETLHLGFPLGGRVIFV